MRLSYLMISCLFMFSSAVLAKNSIEDCLFKAGIKYDQDKIKCQKEAHLKREKCLRDVKTVYFHRKMACYKGL